MPRIVSYRLPFALGAVALLGSLMLARARTTEAQPSAARTDEPGAGQTVSLELTRLFEEDQADRKGGLRGRELRERDRLRRARVDELLADDLVLTPGDRYHAAVVYQHSPEPSDILRAHALATAAAFDGHAEARWLVAASLDRYLVYSKEPQFFGTQFEQDATGRWVPGRTSKALTPSLREAFSLPDLEEFLRRAERWN